MPFVNHIKQIIYKLEQHRTSNFMGSMLMHHTMTATKYMSRWIEEKNK
jgi:hypothetical protein